MEIIFHDVKSVELCDEYLQNDGMRRIRIKTGRGDQEITLYGDTGLLTHLPKSEDFSASTKLDDGSFVHHDRNGRVK